MNFTSLHFAAFFVIALILGHLLKNRSQRVFLLLASYYFYGVFEWSYLILILVSSALDYVAGLGIEASRKPEQGRELMPFDRQLAWLKPKVWLWLSLILNLGLLGYFKYTNFGLEVLNDLSPYGDTIFAWPEMQILLPIGISFYTFQSLSYTIDVYRGNLEPRRNMVDFALYVAFFPQLVAGPIVRAGTFFEDLDYRRSVRKDDIIIGTTRIVTGFFRKLVLADNLGVLVNQAFAGHAQLNPVDVWIASFAFGFQIYFDFAGYTDIARGVARLFGFEFNVNFLYPMAARNIREHWQRWHISLTTWLRDYLYIPLGGSRVSAWRQHMNLAIVWLLTGLWHGAAYHYVAWGISQWIYLEIHRIWHDSRPRAWLDGRFPRAYGVAARVILMFSLSFGFILFRSETMLQAWHMIGRKLGMFDLPALWTALVFGLSGAGFDGAALLQALQGPAGYSFPGLRYEDYLLFLAFLWTYEYTMNRLQLEYFWKPENKWKLVLYLTALVFACFLLAPPESPGFIYFQF